jgi:hypothetical protein
VSLPWPENPSLVVIVLSAAAELGEEGFTVVTRDEPEKGWRQPPAAMSQTTPSRRTKVSKATDAFFAVRSTRRPAPATFARCGIAVLAGRS